MKTQSFLFIILFLSALFVSCTDSNKDETTNTDAIAVDINNSESQSFESVFKITDLIAFQNSENLPIKPIKRILKNQENYWILTSNQILLLDLRGNMLQSVSSEGNGPGEFQSLDDIRWNDFSKTIEVLDKSSGKLIRYTTSGEFQDEWKNPYLNLATSFYPKGDQYFIYGGTFFNGDGDRAVLVSGKSGEKIAGYSKLGKERNYLNVVNNDTFYEFGGEIEFSFSDNDTIYTLNQEDTKAKYIFDFGEFKTPKEFFDRDFENIMEFRNEASANNYISIFATQSTDQHIFLFLTQGAKFFPTIFDRSSGKVKIIDNWSTDFGDEFSKLSSYLTYAPIGSDDESLYFAIDPYAIKSEIDKLTDNPSLPDFLEQNPYINQIFEDFETYENPYILKLSILDI
ncbi:6-bladed beta-propeller [Algoriphagus hitonicola]|uniref:6-bladed beta-propeller protein n=2 Tax=Algoriphagus hitonicola TaxID=435880 RepID=A0A1I2W040_9BACT|nr:hypothetical protein SAMN04487988_11169 [Algoriphagus hitonicola]